MKVYDCFPFDNEFDMLELRFKELYDVVDHFVIVECFETFRRQPKPLHFWDNRSRFSPFLDKVIHVVDRTILPLPAPCGDVDFSRDWHQRNELASALTDCNDDDVIFLTDVDELPNREQVWSHLPGLQTRLRLLMTLHYFFFDCVGGEWKLPLVAPYRIFKQSLPQFHREDCADIDGRIAQAGWHMCAFGGPERVAHKSNVSAHLVFGSPPFNDIEHIRRCMATPCDVALRPEVHMKFVDVASLTLPQTVAKNIDHYQKLGWFKEGALKL